MSATVQFTKSLAFNLTLHKLFIAVWPDISSRFRGRAVPVRTHWAALFQRRSERPKSRLAGQAAQPKPASDSLLFGNPAAVTRQTRQPPCLVIISCVIPGHGLTALLGRHRAFQTVPRPAAMEDGNDVGGGQRSTPKPRRNLAPSRPRICAKAPPLSGRSVPRASSGRDRLLAVIASKAKGPRPGVSNRGFWSGLLRWLALTVAMPGKTA